MIELLIVIAIIAILAAIIIAATGSARKKARDSRRASDLTEIANALGLYYDKYGEYPTALSNLTPEFLSQVPTDPLDGSNYGYERGTKNNVPRVLLRAELEVSGNDLLEGDVDTASNCIDSPSVVTDCNDPYYCICR